MSIDDIISKGKHNATQESEKFERNVNILLDKSGIKYNRQTRLEEKLKKIYSKYNIYYSKYSKKEIKMKDLMTTARKFRNAILHSDDYKLKEIIKNTDFLENFYKNNIVKKINLGDIDNLTQNRLLDIINKANEDDDIQNYRLEGNQFGYSLNSLVCGYYNVAEQTIKIVNKFILILLKL